MIVFVPYDVSEARDFDPILHVQRIFVKTWIAHEVVLSGL